MEAFQRGISNHIVQYSDLKHDRALVFATTNAFHRYFGSAASRTSTDGKLAFTAAKIGSYNSNVHWYIGKPQSLGQVTSARTRGSSESMRDNEDVELHGATCIRPEPSGCIQLIIVVDAYAIVEPDSESDSAAIGMHMTEVLNGEAKTYVMPQVQLVAMPDRAVDHEKSLLKIVTSSTVSTLLALRNERQAVQKGIRSGDPTTANGGMDLLLHELAVIGCDYPARVVASIIEHYEAK